MKSNTYNPFSSLKALSTVVDIQKFNTTKITRNELPGALNIKEVS